MANYILVILVPMALGTAPDGGAIGGSAHMNFDTMAECVAHKESRIIQNGMLEQSMVCLPNHTYLWEASK